MLYNRDITNIVVIHIFTKENLAVLLKKVKSLPRANTFAYTTKRLSSVKFG